MAPTANQDNHFRTWRTITRARTAVLAETLTKQNILTTLKARRLYATEDENLEVRFTINGHQMGEIVQPGQQVDLVIAIELADLDEPQAEYVVELYTDSVGGVLISDAVNVAERQGNGGVTFEGYSYEAGAVFYFVKIIQEGQDGEDLVWTAPLWFGSGQESASDEPALYVYSRHSTVYHHANCADVARIKLENRREGDTPPEGRRLHTDVRDSSLAKTPIMTANNEETTTGGGRRFKIGLALSGGGFRASIFHLGVIRRLEELGIMKDVDVISSVSGGSIIAAYYVCEMEKRLRIKREAPQKDPVSHFALQGLVCGCEIS